MVSSIVFAAVAFHLIASTSAFTNGTLLPSYLCDLNAQAKGAPTSLAQVLPMLQEADSRVKIAGYHQVKSAPYSSQDLCTAAFEVGSVMQETTNSFVVKTKGGEGLLGLLVWAQDYPSNSNGPRRIGTITNPGLNMVHYPYGLCGETIVHEKTLDDEAFYKSQSAPFTWRVPDCGIHGDFIEIRGICVTEKGFGKFAVQIPTSGVAAFDPKCSESQPKACKSIYDSPAPIRPVYAAPEPLKPSTPAVNAAKTQTALVTPKATPAAATPVFVPPTVQAATSSFAPMYVPPVKAVINGTSILQSSGRRQFLSIVLSAILAAAVPI
ncbi:hypothetical protein CcCBS67573_g00773 [Chytriomyces confervae]|uniref:Reelin domain-containing protein n=1 Tax=Chytriomyces confervae TaxID=246404 RepID=A0A507FQZ0_9FUNG|nr:hypothetical protein CcCBS67573_g00773 [Chytriomyces confervae]